MFLKSLIIKTGSVVIRHILFKKGLNLIVDNTPETNESSGNNVGKTTVLKLIDFCLGSDGTNIYQDAESKQTTKIKEFLMQDDLLIVLEMTDEISNDFIIERNFLKYKKKIQTINGISYSEIDFKKKLQEVVFGVSVEKPTFRQIISKNIRYEKNKLSNVVKVLTMNTTHEEYESLFFFWLGIVLDCGAEKQKLQAQLTTEQSLIKRFQQHASEGTIKQSLAVINRDIDKLKKLKEMFNINTDYKSDLDSLNKIKSQINQLRTKIEVLQFRQTLILESKNSLEQERTDINVNNIQELYASAKNFIPILQTTFEELLRFHNSMIDNKIKYITEELPSLNQELDKIINNDLTFLLDREKVLTVKVQKLGALEELEDLMNKLNQKYEQKGSYEEQLKQISTVSTNIKKIEEALTNINANIDEKKLEDKIVEFNKYFTTISERLYGERFLLSAKRLDRAFTLEITGMDGNLGDGKKKGQIAAFDFAYIQFCDNNSIKCLHFILHDQLETIHGNQLTILSEIANTTNSQYIVPIIKDKIPPSIDIDRYSILSLSQNDKLFKIQ